uniref:Uncharacterized protein n=1 Tax=Strix occidentalis caurina TaxID=311401 RepID=A0A8D0KT59_STROC
VQSNRSGLSGRSRCPSPRLTLLRVTMAVGWGTGVSEVGMSPLGMWGGLGRGQQDPGWHLRSKNIPKMEGSPRWKRSQDGEGCCT